MEDNIENMMGEIKYVVTQHLEKVQYELKDTMSVLNSLPLVIQLRQQIDELNKENHKLKKLLETGKADANIELEIIEVPKIDNDTHHYQDASTTNPDESEGDSESDDDDELELFDDVSSPGLISMNTPTGSEDESEDSVIGISIEVWGRSEGEPAETSHFSKLEDFEKEPEKFGILVHDKAIEEKGYYFLVKKGEDIYYTKDRDDGLILGNINGKVGPVVGKLKKGTAFFS